MDEYTVRHVSTYIISFFTRYNDDKTNDDKNDDLHTSFPVSHSLGLHSADDATIVWWRHNDQTIWRDHVNSDI